MKKIYLDYAATTPLNDDVLEEMLPFFTNKFGNASSVHQFGQEARVAVEVSREIFANLLNCEPGELFFTSGGTESINFALQGSADFLKKTYKTTILTSGMEHKSTLETCKYLEKNGFKIDFVKPNSSGSVGVNEIQNIASEKTGLISLLHINNETGNFNDIVTIGEFCKNRNTLFHCDAVQSFGKYQINLKKLNIDFLSCSAHKIFGPKGVGLIYIKSGSKISPIIFGGSQERKKRGGTENVPGIVGFAKAASLIYENMEKRTEYVRKLKQYFLDRFAIFNPEEIKINSPLETTSPYILNISVNTKIFNISGETLLMLLDLKNIAVSTGSACTSGTSMPSHVLLGLGLNNDLAKNSIRFSFSYLTSFNELNTTLDEFIRILHDAKK